MGLKESALEYANRGLKIFPCVPNGKAPATKNGLKDATDDVKQIERWWNTNPNYNIGMPTGTTNGFIVVDCDLHEEKGEDGYADLRKFEKENGEIPDTVLAMTGGGGYHFFFKVAPDTMYRNRTRVLDAVDIRANGGYVIVPPSIGSSGEYEWEYGFEDIEMAEVNEVIDKLINLRAEEVRNASLPLVIGEGERNDLLFKEAARLRSVGYEATEIVQSLQILNRTRCNPPLKDDEVKVIAESVTKYPKGTKLAAIKMEEKLSDEHPSLDVTGSGKQQKLAQTIHNCEVVIEYSDALIGKIGYNQLSHSIYATDHLPWNHHGNQKREFDNNDYNNLYKFMEQEGLFSQKKVDQALSNVAHRHSFNPLVDMLESVYQQYGESKGYIRKLLPYYLGAEDSEYTFEVLKVYMLGAISRAYVAGTKFDYMPILVGAQGIGKSQFFKRLALDDRFYNDNLNTIEGDKAFEKLHGVWIVEMAELSSLKKAKDVEAIKAFITSTTDRYREPYAKITESHPRMCVFGGTTNSKSFLSDATGNRRFLPIEINKDNVKGSLMSDKCVEDFKRAWGEAMTIYMSGNYSLILPEELFPYIEEMQLKFVEENPLAPVVREWLERRKPDKVNTAMIRCECLGEDITQVARDKRLSNQITQIMDTEISNYEKAVGLRFGGIYGRGRGWIRVGD